MLAYSVHAGRPPWPNFVDDRPSSDCEENEEVAMGTEYHCLDIPPNMIPSRPFYEKPVCMCRRYHCRNQLTSECEKRLVKRCNPKIMVGGCEDYDPWKDDSPSAKKLSRVINEDDYDYL